MSKLLQIKDIFAYLHATGTVQSENYQDEEPLELQSPPREPAPKRVARAVPPPIARPLPEQAVIDQVTSDSQMFEDTAFDFDIESLQSSSSPQPQPIASPQLQPGASPQPQPSPSPQPVELTEATPPRGRESDIPASSILPPCSHPACIAAIPDAQRNNIFEQFSQLPRVEQRCFMYKCVKRTATKRPKPGDSKRKFT